MIYIKYNPLCCKMQHDTFEGRIIKLNSNTLFSS
jgi:hypothetical protein